MSKEQEPFLDGLSYNEVLQLPLERVINPAANSEHQVALGDVLTLHAVNNEEKVGEKIINFLATKPIDAEDLIKACNSWNYFVDKGFAAAMKDMTFPAIKRSLTMISYNVYSEIKEINLGVGLMAIEILKAQASH